MAFDDGKELGNYNTQQHWVTHSDGLFLVYTRRGANNDQFPPPRAAVHGPGRSREAVRDPRDASGCSCPSAAPAGQFRRHADQPEETWVTVTEWMQPRGVEKHGSDNSIFVAKITGTGHREP